MFDIKLVLDTNIYLSAILFGGLPEHILDLARSGIITIYCSDFIIAELQKILKSKFEWDSVKIDTTILEIQSITTRVATINELNIIKEDPSDNNILACALDSDATFIISGDRHLLKLKRYRGIQILTARQFLDGM